MKCSPTDRNVLSISFYGVGLFPTSTQLSGALTRQRDYARMLAKYTILIPGATEGIHDEGALVLERIVARNPITFAVRAYRRAVTLARHEQYDAVMVDNPHIGGVLGIVLRYRLGIPLIVHSMADMLGNPWYRRERIGNRVKHALIRMVFAHADAYRVSTEYEVDRLKRLGYDTRTVVNVPFYVEEEAFTVTRTSRDSRKILYIGRFGPQKDVSTLIRAFARVVRTVPEARLTLVGSGPDLPNCRHLAEQLGVSRQIEFLGAVPYEHIVREYATASIFALTSLYEGTCMVLTEATLAGLAIVATDTAGAHDLCRDGGGWLVPVRDEVKFADALIAALLGETERDIQNAQARDRIAARSKARSLEAFTRLIETSMLRSS